jgi:hypothetical protein
MASSGEQEVTDFIEFLWSAGNPSLSATPLVSGPET